MGQSFYDLLKDAAFAGGGGGSPAPAPVLIEKSVTENGTYTAADDNADGYSSVTVAVPNTYAAGDEGKVVQNGVLVSQTSTSVSQNGTINTTTNNSVTVNVPNTYTAQDEGKVVSSGALVAQSTHKSITVNGTGIDTTFYSSVDVAVPVPEFEVCELRLASGYEGKVGGKLYAINTGERTIITGSIYYTNSDSDVVFDFTNDFIPRFKSAPNGLEIFGVYYDHGGYYPRALSYDSEMGITDSTFTLKLGKLRGFTSSATNKRVPFCVQYRE